MMERLYYARCNGCGRRVAGALPAVSAVEARAYAKRHGWLRVPRRTASEGGTPGADYCLTCAAGPRGISL